jgi:hypothetical protein
MSYIKSLLEQNSTSPETLNIIYVCETWLASGEEYLVEEDIGYEYSFNHETSIEVEQEYGRPHGGAGWIYPKRLKQGIIIEYKNENVSTLKLKDVWIVGMYLPTGKGIGQYENSLLTITSIIQESAEMEIATIIVGDMNADMQRGVDKRKHNQQDIALLKWWREHQTTHNLVWISRLYTQMIDNTFYNQRTRSMIDYIMIANENKTVRIKEVNINLAEYETNLIKEGVNQEFIDLGMNNSDHRALECKVEIGESENTRPEQEAREDMIIPPSQKMRKTLNWGNPMIKDSYEHNLSIILNRLNIEQRCRQLSEEEGTNGIDDITSTLMKGLEEAYELTLKDTQDRDKKIKEGISHIKNKRPNRKGSTPEIRKLHNQKNKFNQRWLATRDPYERQMYNFFRRQIRKLEKEHANQTATARAMKLSNLHKTDQPQFWQTLGNSLDNKTLPTVAKETLKEEYTKMFNAKETMSSQLEINCQEDNAKHWQNIRNKKGKVQVSKYMIRRIIQNLPNKKSPGKSGIANESFKYGGDRIATVMARLIEIYINHKHIPQELNIGIMFPIVKDEKKDPSDFNNTRPITLSECMMSIIEKYILSVLELEYEEQDVQFGFKKDSSTNHAIYTLRETILDNKKKKRRVIACFLDYSKAFDKVNRHILMAKLRNIMNEDHWGLMYKYYSSTMIQIRYETELSGPIRTTIGVKQGGPLSPKLFSLYTDDLLRELKASNSTCTINNIGTGVIAYADDTVILSPNVKELQRALNIVENYCQTHEIQINTNKTKCMILNLDMQKKETIKINGQTIELVRRFKYLGWWVENSMSNKEHLKNRKLAMIISTNRLKKVGINSLNMSVELKKFLMDVYGRSTLLYGVENTFLYKRDYKDLAGLESKIIKNAVKLNKYHSTSLLNDALEIKPLESVIEIRKIKFMLRLMRYPITSAILEAQSSDIDQTHNQATIRELASILKTTNMRMEEKEAIIKKCENKIASIEENIRRRSQTETAKNISYLLKSKKLEHLDTVKKLLHWQHSKELKKNG